MAIDWNNLLQIQEKVREQVERRREMVEEARQGQTAPVPEPQDNFSNLVQPEPEAPQPEEQPEEQPQTSPGEKRAEANQPVVQPVTEPVAEQEEKPVVQPVTPRNTGEERAEANQREVVPQNDTETLFNDWERYVEEQDRANAVNDTTSTPQPVEEAPLVTPVTPNGLPEGAMDWTPEQWAEWQSNSANRQTAVDAANRQAEQARQDKQIEDALNFMQTDLGIPIYGEPTADDIAYAQQLLADGVVPLASDTFASTLETPAPTPEPNTPTEDYPTPKVFTPEELELIDYGVPAEDIYDANLIRQERLDNLVKPELEPQTEPEANNGFDWRTMIDQWENTEAANNELFRESLQNPTPQNEQPEELASPVNTSLPEVPDMPAYEYFGTEPPQEEILFPTDFGGTSANPYDYPGRNNGYVSTEYLRENPEASAGGVYDAIADIINASESDGWATQQASDLYGTLPAIDPETPGAEILEEQRRDRINSLIRQIEADDELVDERPKITGKDVKNVVDSWDLPDKINDVSEFATALYSPSTFLLNTYGDDVVSEIGNMLEADNTPYDEALARAQQAALDENLIPGTTVYNDFVNQYMNDYEKSREDKQARLDDLASQLLAEQDSPRQERYYRGIENATRNAMAVEDQRLDNYRNTVDETYNNLLRAGWDPETAKMLALNNDLFGLYDKQGNYIGAKNPEKTYEAPAYNADGTPNETLQAILNGEFEIDGLKGSDLTQTDYMPGGALHEDYATQILHSFDVDGGFWQNGSVVIPKEIIDLMATDPSNAFGELFQTGFDANLDLTPVGRNAGNVQYANVTDEQWMAAVEAFIKANPALEKLVTDGILTQDDIASHFFKAPISAKASGSKPKGSGSGSGYGYGRYSGGGGGGGYSGGGGGGYSSGGYSSAPSAKTQTEQRINNIMKNWTF